MENILTEAFKAFNLLDEEVFTATEDGEEKLKKFLDGDKIEDVEIIIDPDAETEVELKKSYIGDVILNCPICQSKIYKEPKDVVIDEEKQLVNVEEECPYCQTPGGFEIVGEVAEYRDHKEDEDFEEEIVEESFLKEYTNMGQDLAEYQKWVDYDMDTYGHISKETRGEISRAGLEIIKDDHGDYEVVAKSREKLGEAKYKPDKDLSTIKGTIAKLLTDNIDKLYDSSSERELKDKVNTLLDNSEIKDKPAVKDFKAKMDKAKSKEGLLSMITSYITGITVNKNIGESFEEVEVKTDKEKIKVEQEGEETKVSIKPREDGFEDFEEKEEEIVPVSDELKAEIIGDQDSEEVDIDEFDEESFDELEERYLKKIYENVKSYKTTKGMVNGNTLKLEGIITFNSGNKKKTLFTFESFTKTKKGKVKLLGENLNFSTNKKAFTITGVVNKGKLITESFTYNYNAKDAKTGKSSKLYGTVRK